MDFGAEKQMLAKALLNVRQKLSNNAEKKLNAIEKAIDDIQKPPSEALTNCVKSLEQKVTNCTDELLKLESDVTDAKMRHKDLLMQLDASQRCCEDEEAKLNSLIVDNNALEQKVSEKQKMASVEVAENQEFVDFNSNNLGLRIRRISSASKFHNEFQFTNIDKRNPEKIFSISIKLNDDRSYSVTDCRPHIRDLRRLVARLSETDDWHSFLVILRQRFVVSASQL